MSDIWPPILHQDHAIDALAKVVTVQPNSALAFFQAKQIGFFDSSDVLKWSRYLGRSDNILLAVGQFESGLGDVASAARQWADEVSKSVQSKPWWAFWRRSSCPKSLRDTAVKMLDLNKEKCQKAKSALRALDLLERSILFAREEIENHSDFKSDAGAHDLVLHLQVMSQTIRIIRQKIDSNLVVLSNLQVQLTRFSSATSAASLVH